jgi:hypothetical protein
MAVIPLACMWLSATAACEQAERASVCQLVSDPATFNHKLIEITAFVSHGFEDFTLQDPGCNSIFGIWLEYGGRVSSGTVYCCGATNARSRPDEMQVENVTVPLVEDETFRRFDRLLQVPGRYAMAHATLVGRFFSGRRVPYLDGHKWGGFGHMGCCTLLVIQQVISVDSQDRDDLNYESFLDSPNLEKLKCGTYRQLVADQPYKGMLKAQAEAEAGDRAWAFDDPHRVAVTDLATLLKIEPATIAGIKESRKSQGKIIYEWALKGQEKKYMLVVARPYWLSFYSHQSGKVAWVLAAAYEECGS